MALLSMLLLLSLLLLVLLSLLSLLSFSLSLLLIFPKCCRNGQSAKHGREPANRYRGCSDVDARKPLEAGAEGGANR